jgi:hypothetical protein
MTESAAVTKEDIRRWIQTIGYKRHFNSKVDLEETIRSVFGDWNIVVSNRQWDLWGDTRAREFEARRKARGGEE